jgi:hypothetical protein
LMSDGVDKAVEVSKKVVKKAKKKWALNKGSFFSWYLHLLLWKRYLIKNMKGVV